MEVRIDGLWYTVPAGYAVRRTYAPDGVIALVEAAPSLAGPWTRLIGSEVSSDG